MKKLSEVCEFRLIETDKDAVSFGLKAAASGICAIDTETTGLHWARGDQAFMATFCVDTDEAFACYSADTTLWILRVLEQSGTDFLFHNAIFDLHMLRAWTGWRPVAGYKIIRLHDTMHAMRIQYPGQSAKLKDISQRFARDVDVTGPQAEVKAWLAAHRHVKRVAGKLVVVEEKTYQDVPRDIMLPYAVQDAWLTLVSHKALQAEREANVRPTRYAKFPTLNQVYEREMILTKIVADIELAGLHVDMKTLTNSLDQCAHEITRLEDTWQDLTGGINHRSTPQLVEYIYNVLGETPKHVTEKGTPATGEFPLRDMENRAVADTLLLLRAWSKYRDRLTEILSYTALDGAVHTSLKSDAARTGRFSSSAPALQNHTRPNPKRDYTMTRAVFGPPAGYEWLFVDFSQIELRLAAHYMQDEGWLQAFRDGVDLHSVTAAKMYGYETAWFLRAIDDDKLEGEDAYKEVKPKRSMAKTINFSILYGAGIRRLTGALRFGAAGSDPLEPAAARNAIVPFLRNRGLTDAKIDAYMREVNADKTDAKLFESLAKEILDAYHRENPSVKAFTKKAGDVAKRAGFVVTAFGLNIPIDPDMSYAACNAIIQGTAAGLMKETIIRVDRALELWCADQNFTMWQDVKILMSIHDELIIQVPVGASNSVAKRIRPVMTDWPQFNVQIEVEFAIVPEGGNWAFKEGLKVA